MLSINGITVRLGGRTILERASATITPGSKVGLIGRNGAGKSTLMKVIIGQLDPDEGEIEMPRRTRLGYIAQEAPSGTATPFETVLGADVELDGVNAGEPVVVRASYYPAWRAHVEAAGVELFEQNGQLAFRAPRDGTYTVRFEYPRYRFVSLIAICALLAGVVGLARWPQSRS